MPFLTHMSKDAIFNVMQNVFFLTNIMKILRIMLIGTVYQHGTPRLLFSTLCHVLCSILRLNVPFPWQKSSQMNYDDFYLDSNANPSQKAFNSSKFHNNPMNIFSADLSCWTNKMKTVDQSQVMPHVCWFHVMCLEMITKLLLLKLLLIREKK